MASDKPGRLILLSRAFSIVWRSSPPLAVWNLILVVLQGLLPLIPLYLMKLIVDSVENAVSGGSAVSFGHIGLLVGLMGGVALLTAVIRSIAGLVGQTQAMIVTDRMQDVLHEKSVSVDLAYYEDSRFYDTLHRAQNEAPNRPTSIVNGLIQTVQSLVSLIAMTGLLLTFHWAVALVLAAAVLPGVLVKLKFSRIKWRWQRERTETERRSWYKHWLLTSVDHAKELRLFGLGGFFRERYRTLRKVLREEALGIARRRVVADVATQAVATVLVYGSFAFIAWRAYNGSITLGDLVMYFAAFQKGLGYLRGFLGSLAGLYEGNLFLSNLFEFLDIEPRVISPENPVPFPSPVRSGIVFDHVSFGYPSGNPRALEDISLTVSHGEVLALVGENGSGKTTLVKLLCRLYDPGSGEVTVDGVSLRDFDVSDLRSRISVVFQDYAKYHLTAAENIRLGDIRRPPGDPAIREAASVAGADELISGLPEGYDTVLGRWFKGGKELSIGEWQKIALARAFVRDAPIVVLDEPTSALDARSEREVFTRFRELVQGRTSIVISHRFSTVRMADRIAVMHRGKVIEQGTHDELMRLDGKYREMYSIQADAYA